jgi:hypothetical protein
MSPADLVYFPPLCLAVVFVWAATREETPRAVLRHGLVLAGKVAVGMVVLGVALQALLWILG